MIKNGGNFCYKLDFAAATLAVTFRQTQKLEVKLEWESHLHPNHGTNDPCSRIRC